MLPDPWPKNKLFNNFPTKTLRDCSDKYIKSKKKKKKPYAQGFNLQQLPTLWAVQILKCLEMFFCCCPTPYHEWWVLCGALPSWEQFGFTSHEEFLSAVCFFPLWRGQSWVKRHGRFINILSIWEINCTDGWDVFFCLCWLLSPSCY